MPIRILIVDQNDGYRAPLAWLLAARSGLDVVGQATGGKLAVRLAAELRPDVILMDPRLPDLDGAAAARAILRRDGSTRLVALSSLEDAAAVTTAVRAGFCGYLLKDSPIDDVVAAIRAAAQGTAWLAPRTAQVVLDRFNHNGSPPDLTNGAVDGLSRHETGVLPAPAA